MKKKERMAKGGVIAFKQTKKKSLKITHCALGLPQKRTRKKNRRRVREKSRKKKTSKSPCHRKSGKTKKIFSSSKKKRRSWRKGKKNYLNIRTPGKSAEGGGPVTTISGFRGKKDERRTVYSLSKKKKKTPGGKNDFVLPPRGLKKRGGERVWSRKKDLSGLIIFSVTAKKGVKDISPIFLMRKKKPEGGRLVRPSGQAPQGQAGDSGQNVFKSSDFPERGNVLLPRGRGGGGGGGVGGGGGGGGGVKYLNHCVFNSGHEGSLLLLSPEEKKKTEGGGGMPFLSSEKDEGN